MPSSWNACRLVADWRQLRNVLLPVAAIEWRDLDRGDGIDIQAIHVDADAMRVRPGHIEGLNPAIPAETMFRDAGIKSVRL